VGGLSRRAVFLDRDGTLNVRPPEHAYLTSPAEFSWLPGAATGAARLSRAGYVLTVASNQRGVARGLVDPSVLRDIETLIQRDLAHHGCAMEAFRYCLDDESANCACRKPKPGMLLDLARDLDLDLSRSWMIGDSESDVLAGQAAGCRTALIGTAPDACRPDLLASSLDAISALIVCEETSLRHEPRPRPPRTLRPGRGRWSPDRARD
jgi:D-glycero-D-manno-heptose 1,7-bisphosphate phosphatase